MNDPAWQSWAYPYSQLPSRFSLAAVQTVAQRMHKRYARITKEWSVERNTEWFCRVYTAAKLIMHATLTLNSMRFAKEKNLLVVVPYLTYYSYLSLLRAVVMFVPEKNWEEGQLVTLDDASAINLGTDAINAFDKSVAESFAKNIRKAKATRELISYRAPSSGYDDVLETEDVVSQCRTLAEIAQLYSEILERSFKKHSDPEDQKLLDSQLAVLYSISIGPERFRDSEDCYRVDRYLRREPKLTNLYWFFQQGHVEDFFGAWYDPEDRQDVFNPDDEFDLIFDLP